MKQYRLVKPAPQPKFPPHPKLNPWRRLEKSDVARSTPPRQPVFSSVAEIPLANNAPAKTDPFTVIKKAHAAPARGNEVIRRAREKVLRTPGLGDEAMLSAVASKSSVPARPRAAKQPAKITSQRSKSATGAGRLALRDTASAVGRASEETRFHGAHLGTFLDPRKALRGWRYIYRAHRDLLRGLKPRIRRADLGVNGMRYRLRVIPFVNADAAAALCAKLAARGKFCRPSFE